jgi:hypothetical protein
VYFLAVNVTFLVAGVRFLLPCDRRPFPSSSQPAPLPFFLHEQQFLVVVSMDTSCFMGSCCLTGCLDGGEVGGGLEDEHVTCGDVE